VKAAKQQGQNMFIPVGSGINAAAIIAGGGLGLLLGNRLNERLRKIVFQALGLCILIIGLQMALPAANPLLLVFSLLLGGLLGELGDLEGALAKGGDRLKRALRSESGGFTDGFVSATVLFGVGSMAILGPLDEGMSGDRTILLTKAVLDGFSAMAFAAAFGSGVLFSALPIFIMQGLITLCAASLQAVLTEAMILSIKAAGGVIILGIALNMLELCRIKLANLLPALPAAALLAYLLTFFA
jgi:uncharacterized membrane protein YqgA involved in biofilm formation